MKIIISPAKKMKDHSESLPAETRPVFLNKTKYLLSRLRAESARDLQKMWACNDQIFRRNVRRVQEMDLERATSPALLSFEGIQYKYLAPFVLEAEGLAYLQEHLRIVSAFYGLIRPLDAVCPYRLEMQHTLGNLRLYDFWAASLAEEIAQEEDLLINLASKEYSAAIIPHLPERVRVITCVFGQLKEGRVVQKGTLAKMARGEMVRYMASNKIMDPKKLKAFDALGYSFSAAHSHEDTLVFLT